MAGYRKLGRTSSQRKALLRNQVTDLLYYGKIVTTEAKAKEIRKIAEGIIALGVKECNNFDTVKVTAKVARKDKDGKERQLHVQQSIDVTTVPSNNDSNKLFTNTHLDHGSKTRYVESEFFTVDCYRMEGENIVVNDKPCLLYTSS